MKRFMLLVAALLLSGVGYGETVIVDPSVYPAGTDVTAAYPGVRLNTAEGTSQVYYLEVWEPLHLISDVTLPVYVNATGNRFAHPAGDVWSANSLCCGSQTNVLKITFDKPVSSVAVLFDAGEDTAILQIYDHRGVLLAESYQRFTGPNTLSLDAPPKKKISFALATFGDTGRIGPVTYTVPAKGKK
ncbi:MAG: hypothetical protein U1F09_02115 [Steroidobacteraceae bacterium]